MKQQDYSDDYGLVSLIFEDVQDHRKHLSISRNELDIFDWIEHHPCTDYWSLSEQFNLGIVVAKAYLVKYSNMPL